MACLTPNIVSQVVDDYTGAVVSKFLGRMPYGTDPNKLPGIDALIAGRTRQILVPCGHCLGCLTDRSALWSRRLAIEYLDNDCRALFVTLTYRNADVPVCESGLTLDKRDCQLFLKRLRKEFSGIRIRFFLTGEYGDKTHRPHYHAILFGLTDENFPDKRILYYNDLHQPIFTSPSLEKLWSKGIISFGAVSQHSINYVARYTLKKLGAIDNPDLSDKRSPVFSLMSRRPGIGYLRPEYWSMLGVAKVPFADANGVTDLYIPRCIFKKCSQNGNTPFIFPSYDSIVKDESRDSCHGYATYDDYCKSVENRLVRLSKLRKDVI